MTKLQLLGPTTVHLPNGRVKQEICMLTHQTKPILTIGLFVSILSVLGCLSLKQIVEVAGDNREQLPIRSLVIRIDPSQRPELFEQFRKFADKQTFEIEISDYGSNGEIFQIWMLRDNIKIIANDLPGAPSSVKIKFYDQTRVTPVAEETIETIDDLVVDLKTFINEIPNVTITEEQ